MTKSRRGFVRLRDFAEKHGCYARDALHNNMYKYRDHPGYDMWADCNYYEEISDPLDKVNGYWGCWDDEPPKDIDTFVPQFSGSTGSGMRRIVESETIEGKGDYLRLNSQEESKTSWKNYRKTQYRLSFPQYEYDSAYALSRI